MLPMLMLPMLAVQASGAMMATTPGVHELTLARDGAEEIVYTLSLPAGFEPETPRPLVIALHYGGINQRHFGRGVLTGLVEPGLRSLGAVIAAPDAPAGGWTNAAAERMVLDLMDFLLESYPVDSERIVITGYSLGGMGTWYIAARNPGRFSAAIPMAAAPRGLSEEQLGALVDVPLYAIHSLADDVVPIEPGREAIEKLRELGAERIELEIVDGVTHYNVPGFAPYLRNAARWLSGIWPDR